MAKQHIGPMRAGKTLRDKKNGSHARRLQNLARRRDENRNGKGK